MNKLSKPRLYIIRILTVVDETHRFYDESEDRPIWCPIEMLRYLVDDDRKFEDKIKLNQRYTYKVAVDAVNGGYVKSSEIFKN